MLRTALRSVRRHSTRFALPFLAVLLGVACVSGSLLYGESVRRATTEAQTAARPDVSVEVRPGPDAAHDAAGPPRPDEELRRRLAALPGAAAARGTLEGRALLVGPDGELVGPPSAGGGVGYVPDRRGTDPRYPLTAGRGPRAPGEIALDRRSAGRTGYRVGDSVRVIVNGHVRGVRLVGVFAAHDPRLAGGGTLTAFDTATAARQFAPAPGAYASLTLTAAPGTSPDVLAARAAKLLPAGLQAVPRAQLDAEAAASPDARKIGTLLLVFAGIALLISGFLVGNTFAMLSAARAREHALLRAVGATRAYVLRLVLTEAALLGTVASVAGYLAGIGVAAALGGLFGATGDVTTTAAPLQPLSPAPLLAAFGVGVAVTCLSAYVPARRAAAVPPVAALRTSVPPTGASLRRRNRAGCAVTAAGVLLVLAATGSTNLFAVAVPVLLAGLMLLTPLLAPAVTRLLRAPMARLAGVHGTLALANVRRNPRRTAATAMALTVGLTLVSAVTVALSSLSGMAAREAAAGMPAELRITAVDFADIGDDTAARVARLPHVAAVTPTLDAPLRLAGDSFLPAIGVDPGTVGRIGGLTVRAGSLDRLDEGIAVTAETAAAHGWHVGDRVTGVPEQADGTRGKRAEHRVVAVYDGPEALSPALLPLSALPGAGRTGPGGLSSDALTSVLVTAEPGQLGTLERQIRNTLGNPALLVQDRADAAREAARAYGPLLTTLYAMLSVTVVIGALGVANTMGMAVAERFREIGMLRAIGLDRRGVGRLLRLESVVVSLLGAGLGLLAGSAVGAVAVASQEGAVLTMPWGRLLLCGVATAVIGVLAALVPGRRAATVPVLKALGTDTE
ncbi:ABC transporter permease [Streptomyces sp. Ru73]|uniref:ABC transporter permease n=1 Tax=Streptomyces sp. Ru73 TaxID=2080748 RepID=UPI000CDDA7D7|nr:ABC transporter permease [Streptomyces sp. Ru73]POX42520.1 ABC transporter permease [Streptomyces sp. Ru73]